MIDLKYDTDLVIENGDLMTVGVSDAMVQRIKDRLLTFRGEWFLDLGFGPDYRSDILVKNPRLDVVNAKIKEQIIKSQPGNFVSFAVSLGADRVLRVEYELDTTGGTITDTVTI